MKATVAICTWNREKTLGKVLEGLARQVLLREDFEVIVVDNNSTDRTCELVAGFAAQSDLPVRYIFEGNQGLSRARNRGIQESRGEVVAFLDDDAVPEPDWLEKLVEPYGDSGVGCVGGRVLLRWPAVCRPSWLTPIFYGYYAAFGWETERPVALGEDNFPYGANISFRRAALDKVGCFRVALGSRGHAKIGGDETELCTRLYRRGWKILYAPRAVVHHLVDAERISKGFLLRYARTQGISNVLMDKDGDEDGPRIHLLGRYLFLLAKHSALCLKNVGRRDWRFFFRLFVVRELSSIRYYLTHVGPDIAANTKLTW